MGLRMYDEAVRERIRCQTSGIYLILARDGNRQDAAPGTVDYWLANQSINRDWVQCEEIRVSGSFVVSVSCCLPGKEATE